MSRGLSHSTRLMAALIAAMLAALLPATAALANNHTGNIYFCPTSSSCSSIDAVTPAADATAYVAGAALMHNTSVTVRYAVTATPPDDACHIGTSLGSVTTNSSGNIPGTLTVTMPGPGNWTFCATNATGAQESNHLALAVPVVADTTPLAVGPNHALSVKTDGTVFARGQNNFGQLGNGTTANSPANVVPGLTSVASQPPVMTSRWPSRPTVRCGAGGATTWARPATAGPTTPKTPPG